MSSFNLVNDIVRMRGEAGASAQAERRVAPRESASRGDDDSFGEILDTVLRDGIAGGGSGRGPERTAESVPHEYGARGRAERLPAGLEAKDRKLMDACLDFESIFVAKMFKEMRKNIGKTGWLDGGFAEEIFQDMLYDEYSKQLSKNSNLGLAKMVYTQLGGK